MFLLVCSSMFLGPQNMFYTWSGVPMPYLQSGPLCSKRLQKGPFFIEPFPKSMLMLHNHLSNLQFFLRLIFGVLMDGQMVINKPFQVKCPFFSVHKSEDDNCLQQSQANGPNYKVINKVGKLLFYLLRRLLFCVQSRLQRLHIK